MPLDRLLGSLALGFALLSIGLVPRQQAGESCTLEVQAAPGTRTQALGLSREDYRIHVRGEVEATCGTSRVRADSAIYYEGRGELYLYGNVRYRSGQRTLESDRATYFAGEDRVLAEGSVKLMDTQSGSVLSGPVLHYYPANEARPVERIFAPRRPHLTVRSGESGEAPFEVDADRIHMYGDSVVGAAGRAIGMRADLTTRGDSMHVDRAGDRLWLFGDPTVDAGGTVLEGDTILALLEDQRVREVEAWPNASARGEELTLDAPTIRVFIGDQAVTRVVASPRRGTDTDGGLESPSDRAARSESPDYVLSADSIEVLRPGGRLDRVIAVNRARAEATKAVIPDDTLLGRDWIEGDTIIGHFVPGDSADGTVDSPELDRLVASGAARALYHIREEDAADGAEKPAINYVIGRVITIWLQDGEAREARVTGPGTGLYLEPLREGEVVDTAAVDTAGGAAGDTAIAPASNPDDGRADTIPGPGPR